MMHIRIALTLLLSAAVAPAASQTRSLFDQPEAQDARPAKAKPQTTVAPGASEAAKEQDRFIERIQRADSRATASICADGCRGEFRRSGQPKDPFAPLPDFTDELPTAYTTEP
ncbi:MAG TPA: hypothetical protein VGU45_02800 [Microvirga sp.]|jgi:hypothetical protein|nr:hypothetical protein [Microvirga sp.]